MWYMKYSYNIAVQRDSKGRATLKRSRLHIFRHLKGAVATLAAPDRCVEGVEKIKLVIISGVGEFIPRPAL